MESETMTLEQRMRARGLSVPKKDDAFTLKRNALSSGKQTKRKKKRRRKKLNEEKQVGDIFLYFSKKCATVVGN